MCLPTVSKGFRQKWCISLLSPTTLSRHGEISHDSALTRADHVILRNLAKTIRTFEKDELDNSRCGSDPVARLSADGISVSPNGIYDATGTGKRVGNDASDLTEIRSFNDPTHQGFEPNVFLSLDNHSACFTPTVCEYVLQPYIRWARQIVRRETDIPMLTHLILYSITSAPSALVLYWHFTYLHGLLHVSMQLYYIGTYTLMMHQHIHMRGILARKYSRLDYLFPYFTDPLMGHTWNSYFYHHVKHHHVEGNGPDDLSSTIRYDRDNFVHFLHYVSRFFFLIWLDLPLYFLRKGQLVKAVRAAGSEFLSYAFYCMVALVNANATFFVFILPLLSVRLGLMIGNWGQHAFVDPDSPDSDFRSSITLIDVTVCHRNL